MTHGKHTRNHYRSQNAKGPNPMRSTAFMKSSPLNSSAPKSPTIRQDIRTAFPSGKLLKVPYIGSAGHSYVRSDTLKNEFEKDGFSSIREVQATHSPMQLQKKLRQNSESLPDGDTHPPDYAVIQRQFRRAKRRSLMAENYARFKASSSEPAAAMLRDCASRGKISPGDSRALHLDLQDQAIATRSQPQVALLSEEDVIYVDPESIQSILSPAAYLTNIYNLAKEKITTTTSLSLDIRRPDLKHFSLTVENLDQELATITIAKEVLIGQLLASDVAENEESLFEMFETSYYPMEHPYHLQCQTVRDCLNTNEECDMNVIGNWTRHDGYALSDTKFSLVPNVEDKIGLFYFHREILKNEPGVDLYTVWFGTNYNEYDPDDFQYADTFCEVTKLSFDEFRQLIGDDANVKDEDGLRYPNISSRFLTVNWEVILSEDVDGEKRRFKTYGKDLSNPESELKPLPPIVHEVENKCIRLQRRSHIPFYELNWLLMNALYVHVDYDAEKESQQRTVLADPSTLTMLAHYLDYKERFDLRFDEFAALFGDVNCYHRNGTCQQSLMKQLFNLDAPEVTRRTRRYDASESVSVGELKTSEFGKILRRGFTLSSGAWNVVLDVVSSTKDNVLNSLMMGRIYRVSRFFRLIGWNVVEGITLTKSLEGDLMTVLGTKNDSDEVFIVMDKLIWLSKWMNEQNISPSEMTFFLFHIGSQSVTINQDIINWILTVQQKLKSYLVQEGDFGLFQYWPVGDTSSTENLQDPADPPLVSPAEWVSKLGDMGVLDSDGLVKTDRTGTTTVVGEILSVLSVDTDDEDVRGFIDELVGKIDSKRGSQHFSVSTEISARGATLAESGVDALLKWMGKSYYDVEQLLFNWDTSTVASTEVSEFLFDLQRHFFVLDKVKMGIPEIDIVGTHPTWLANDMGAVLSLKQFYLLSRFKSQQNEEVSSNDWSSYFGKVERDNSATLQADNHKNLSSYLHWPAHEIALLAVGSDIGIVDGRIATVQHVDLLKRRIEVCQNLSVGASDLLVLETLNESSPDWGGAMSASMMSLYSYDGGKFYEDTVAAVDEYSRDALVGSFLTKLISISTTLRAIIKNRDDLYTYLLLDINVSKDVPTSRLLENIGAVQIFINMNLNNVEGSIIEDKKHLQSVWETAQQYQLWKASNLLSLYPSSYIEPELRQGRTELFLTLEQDLTQGDLNDDTVESAVTGYLDGLQHLSELKVQWMFHVRNGDVTVYYFTARSTWERHQYFYRKMELLRTDGVGENAFDVKWGPWNSIKLPVAVDIVYGAIPALLISRLFMFWFEIEKITVTTGSREDTVTKDTYYLRPKMARENLDGSISEPWPPHSIADEVNLNVTEQVENNSLYEPTIYQPIQNYIEGGVLLYFSTDDKTVFHDPEGRKDLNLWRFYVRSSTNIVERMEGVLVDTPRTMEGYEQIPKISRDDENFYDTFNISDMKTEPSMFQNDIIEISMESNNATVSIVNSSVTLSTELNSVQILWNAESVHFKGDPDFMGSGVGFLSMQLIVSRDDAIGGNAVRIISTDAKPIDYDGYLQISPTYFKYTIQLDDARRPEVTVKVVANFSSNGGSGIAEYAMHFICDFITDDFVNSVFLGKVGTSKHSESYLVREDEEAGTILLNQFSTGIHAVTQTFVPGGDISNMFSLEKQRLTERGVDSFISAINRYDGDIPFEPIANPIPKDQLDFNGPYGIYAWEFFFYFPTVLSVRRVDKYHFDSAIWWLRQVFDMQGSEGYRWKVWPLIDEPTYFDFESNDPDEIGRRAPYHYKLSTIRQLVEGIIAEGDYYYRQETTETLRQAKLVYMQAFNLFMRDARSTLEFSTRADWGEYTLQNVTSDDFRQPYNENVYGMVDTLEERLGNLRQWRSIDGEPLTIPLIAPPIDPRQLQLAALAGIPPAQAQSFAQMTLPYTFDAALSKAKSAVQNLMYFGDLLTRSIYLQDKQKEHDMQAELAAHVAENFEVRGQISLIESLEMEMEILEKEKEETETYISWYGRFKDELNNSHEKSGYDAMSSQISSLSIAKTVAITEGVLMLVPCIYGFSIGGYEPEGIPGSIKETMEYAADSKGVAADRYFHKGDVQRRQEENQMEYEATMLAKESIELSIARLQYDIGEEEGTLDVLKTKSKKTEELVEFQNLRSTNSNFYMWYISQINSLYEAGYDLSVRFCRLAEKAYQADIDLSATFIYPVWNASYRGLLAGQSLMLDLQRMEYAHLERYEPALSPQEFEISLLSAHSHNLPMLKKSGQLMFAINEDVFEEQFPRETNRRIHSVRVEFNGLDSIDAPISAQLVLIGHRVNSHKQSEKNSLYNAFGRQKICLSRTVTDTSEISDLNGRLRPFERCGVQTSWRLCFPSAVRDIMEKKTAFTAQTLLNALTDVKFRVRYTSKSY